MHITASSWGFAFLILGTLAFFAGSILGRARLRFTIKRDKGDRDPPAQFVSFMQGLMLILIFCAVSYVTMFVVEVSIQNIVHNEKAQTSQHEKMVRKLDDRFLLSPGWYEVAENPMTIPLFKEFGDTTEYVVVSLRRDGIGPLSVAFPLDNWCLIPPRPILKYLGRDWVKVSLPQPALKLIKLEQREEKEYARDVYVVGSK